MDERCSPILVVSCLLVASAANAQDQSRLGLTMGYPATVGVIWHVSPALAVRPEFSFSQATTTSTAYGSPSYSTDGSAWGVGASALFYVHQWDKARVYASPRFLYSRTTTTTTQSSPTGSASNRWTGNAYAVSGSLGAQYSFARRFGVFGEAGFGYTDSRTSYPVSETKATTWATRTAVGVILYF